MRKESTYGETFALLRATIKTLLRIFLVEEAGGSRVDSCALGATQAEETAKRRRVGGRFGRFGSGLGLTAGGGVDGKRRFGSMGPRANGGNDSGSTSRGTNRRGTGLTGHTKLGPGL